jgi:hypothetical protein
VLEALRAGASVCEAAERGRIPERTLRNWLREGRRQPSGRFAAFADAVDGRRARLAVLDEPTRVLDEPTRVLDADAVLTKALAEDRLVALVAAAARGNWRAASWLLERRYPERWAADARRDALAEPSPKQRDDLARLREIHRAAEAEAQS